MKENELKTVVTQFPFLSSVKAITPDEELRLGSMIASWNVISIHLQSMTLDELEKAMVIELFTKSRLGILNRLNTRRRKLRDLLEDKTISLSVLNEEPTDSQE